MSSSTNISGEYGAALNKKEEVGDALRPLYTEVKIFGRVLNDYLTMFSISDTKIHEWVHSNYAVLDCNSGPSSFAAQVYENYSLAITCADPIYLLSPAKIKQVSERDIEELFTNLHDVRNSPDDGGLMFGARYWHEKFQALADFAADFERLQDLRYVACRLPNLPFETRSFDVVLSSHFLFAYAPYSDGGIMDDREAGQLDDSHTFDLQFHLRAMDELARVSKHEIRIFPVTCIGNWVADISEPHLGAKWHPYLGACVERLQEIGFETKVLETTYYKGVLLIATRI